jgi:hypothetical protein
VPRSEDDGERGTRQGRQGDKRNLDKDVGLAWDRKREEVVELPVGLVLGKLLRKYHQRGGHYRLAGGACC